MVVRSEIRLTKDALRYGFAVGKVRVLETRMLDRAAYERLLDAQSLAEQRRLLSETVYGRYVEHAETAEELEHGLDEALDGFYGYLDQAALPHEVVQFFRVRYDFANLKAALKARLFDAPLEGMIVVHGTVPPEMFSADLEDLPGPLGSLASRLAAEEDPETVDVAVDVAMYAELARLAKKAKSAYLTRMARLIVDVGNLKTIVRGKHAGRTPEAIQTLLAAGGTVRPKDLGDAVGASLAELPAELKRFPAYVHLPAADLTDPTELDLVADGLMIAALRDGRRGPTGPEPVIAYVFAREYEVAALRTLLLGKLRGIPNDTLRARLRASYR